MIDLSLQPTFQYQIWRETLKTLANLLLKPYPGPDPRDGTRDNVTTDIPSASTSIQA